MKIATWNVNSLRVRLEHVLTWLKAVSPDVLALQETKVTDTLFPVETFQAVGYYAIFSGQPTYNGVALLAKSPFLTNTAVTHFPDCLDDQRRVLGIPYQDVYILNLYVPNGAAVGSEKYGYKLTWLAHLEAFLREKLCEYPKLVVLGDFNIAPGDQDVHNPAVWEGSVLVSPPERDAWQRLLSLGLFDSLSHTSGAYTWWDYRHGAFRQNHGARIDHVLLSKTLASLLQSCHIDREPRGWERPSDHAPVIVRLDY